MTLGPRAVAAFTLAFTVAALGWLWSNQARLDQRREITSLAALADIVGSRRVTVGRPTGGFRHAPPATTRAAGTGVRVVPDLVIAAARIEARAMSGRRGDDLELLGVARLIAGDVDGAVQILSSAAVASPDCASCWSNLAAAYLERTGATPVTTETSLLLALDAGEHAVTLAPEMVEARFNLAHVKERIGHQAAEAWREVLAVEVDEAWRSEAMAHLDTLAARHGREVPGVAAFADLSDAELAIQCRDHPGVGRAYAEDVAFLRWAEGVERRERAVVERARRRLDLVAGCLVAAGDRHVFDTLSRVPHEVDAPAARRYARLFSAYQRGTLHYERGQETAADAALRTAEQLAADVRSPFRWLVALQRATVAYQRRDLAEARRGVEAVNREARRAGYASLETRATILAGTVEMQAGRLRESHLAYAAAATQAGIALDPDLAATAAYSLANTARLVGEPLRGWRALLPMLPRLGQVDNQRRRLMVLYNASMLAEHEGRLFAALRFQEGALATAVTRGVSGSIAEARIRRAWLLHRLGRDGDAAVELQEAARLFASVDEPSRLAYYRALHDAVSGRVTAAVDPAGAIRHLDRALAFFARVEPADVPMLYLARGRGHAALGAAHAAIPDFLAGIEALESLRRRTSDQRDRVSLFDTGWELFEEMVSAHADDTDAAFAYAERGRARGLLDAVGSAEASTAPQAVAARLPDGVSMLFYAPLKEQTLLWLLRADGVQAFRLPLGVGTLAAESRRYLEAVRASQADEPRLSRHLYTTLLGPVAGRLHAGDTVVVVGDAAIATIPFAALTAATGRRLVQDFDVAYAPSARVFLRAQATRSQRSLPVAKSRVLAVGNPAGVQQRHPQLLPLLGAEQEARAIGALYPHATVLTDDAATKRRFLDEMTRADVVHIGTHTVLNEEFPAESELLFAPDPHDPDGALTVADLASHGGRAPALAVLAACSTIQGTPFRLEGIASLARAFLAAGTPQVVGTLWDVNDARSAGMFVAMHAEMSRGVDPVMALNRVQRAALDGDRAAALAPAHWAAYVALGAVAPGAAIAGAQ